MVYAVIVIAVVVLFLIIVSMRPATFSLTRKGSVGAPPTVVFAQVNDFHKWEAWSPWARLDPNCKNTFEGAAAGKGAIFSWSGNNKVGEGRMTITESRPSELVLIRLEFFKPFKATNTTEFTFKPEGGGTLVSWTMSGRNNFIAKAFSIFMNCEKMVGPQFEQGLANLKQVTEAAK